MPAKIFCELVVEGPFPVTKGFIAGLLEGKGIKEKAIYSRECGIKRDSLSELIKEWLGVHENLTHLVVSAGVRSAINRTIKNTHGDLGLSVRSDRRIKNASFKFEYHSYAREYGEELKAIFKTPGAGIKLLKYKPVEKFDPNAGGLEMYAPAHEYELSGSGIAIGPFESIFAFHKGADDHSLVEVEDITLHF